VRYPAGRSAKRLYAVSIDSSQRTSRQRTKRGRTRARPAPPRRLSAAEYAILGLLASADELSGYDLNRIASQSTSIILAPTKSRIYTLLPRLLADGLVAQRQVTQATRPDKTLFRLTEAGRRTLRGWLNDTAEVSSRSELVLKVFLGAHADVQALVEQLEMHRQSTLEVIELLERVDERQRRSTSEVHYFENLTLQLGLASNRAALAWTEQTIARLRRRRDASRRAGETAE
jgi:PadR family transcriptional regulator AphA